jgi:hypothetical protein
VVNLWGLLPQNTWKLSGSAGRECGPPLGAFSGLFQIWLRGEEVSEKNILKVPVFYDNL